MSVWSDPRVIELAKEFVAATDEVWRLQGGVDPECKFFQEMAEHGHYGGRPGTSRQGIYVCAPSGEFLASINSNSPDRVLAIMQQGKLAWSKLAKTRGCSRMTPKLNLSIAGRTATRPMAWC